jgi:hypothetical protein
MRLAGSFLIAFCCLSLEVQAQKPYFPATRLLLPGAECALFPATATLPDAPEFDEALTARFAPIWPQVIEAEQTLSTALSHSLTTAQPARYISQRQAIVRAYLPAYRRQYFGFYNAQHQACLFINAFYNQYTNPLDPSWLHYCISVDDGGVGFWRIYYNLATHRFYKFSSNEDG